LYKDREYEKIGNKKRDEKNKFVAKIGKENDVIAVQDENIAEWKSSKKRGIGKRRRVYYRAGRC
jgi:hypothetical protein